MWISCNGDNPSPGIKPDGTVTSPTVKFWADADQLFEIAKSERVYLMIALISFDHTKKGNRNYEAWQNMQKTAAGRASFVSQYVTPFVKRYAPNLYFFAIDVGNEFDWHWDNQGMRQGDTVDLIARVANAVHKNSKVLVCQGMGTAAKYLSAKYQGQLPVRRLPRRCPIRAPTSTSTTSTTTTGCAPTFPAPSKVLPPTWA